MHHIFSGVACKTEIQIISFDFSVMLPFFLRDLSIFPFLGLHLILTSAVAIRYSGGPVLLRCKFIFPLHEEPFTMRYFKRTRIEHDSAHYLSVIRDVGRPYQPEVWSHDPISPSVHGLHIPAQQDP